jgi:hypothetical protein
MKKYMKTFGQHRRYVSRDSSRTPPEYKSRALSLRPSAQCNKINFAIYRWKELAERPSVALMTRRARSVHMGFKTGQKNWSPNMLCCKKRESTCKWIKLHQSGSIQRTESSQESRYCWGHYEGYLHYITLPGYKDTVQRTQVDSQSVADGMAARLHVDS